jgi:hypothetical protein
VPKHTRNRVLPWASAAGVAVLVAGTVAAQSGAAHAATAPQPQPAPAPAFNTQNMPAEVKQALKNQFDSITKHQRTTPKAAKVAKAPVAPAKVAKQAGAFDFRSSSYILTIRSGGIEYYDDIPRELQQDQGFSYVDLLHDLGQPNGRCESFSGAYWLGQEVEEGVLGFGAAPPDAGPVTGGYHNPFTSRDVEPNLSAGSNQSNRSPGVVNYFPPGQTVLPLPTDGPGYKWTAKCADDTHGKAQGDTFNIGGVQVIGSTSEGGLDKTTGMYTGTSRSYVFGMEGASGFDSASSFMQITNAPDSDAKITYRMSYFNSGTRPARTGSRSPARTSRSSSSPTASTTRPRHSPRRSRRSARPARRR